MAQSQLRTIKRYWRCCPAPLRSYLHIYINADVAVCAARRPPSSPPTVKLTSKTLYRGLAYLSPARHITRQPTWHDFRLIGSDALKAARHSFTVTQILPPRCTIRISGGRFPERQREGSVGETLTRPAYSAPEASVAVAIFASYQSRQISDTFPCISYIPQLLGSKDPTATVDL